MNAHDRRAVLACFLILLISATTRADPPKVNVLTCRTGDCVTAADRISAAEYVWIWSEAAPPTRATPEEAMAIIARGLPAHADHATVHVKRQRADDPTPLALIAAPVRMWGEVPEPLLPRYVVGKDGMVRFPRARDVASMARVTADGQGSWWTPLTRGVTTIVPVASETVRVSVTDPDGKPLPSAGVTVAAALRSGSTPRFLAQHRTDPAGSIELAAVPDREPLTLIASASGYAPEAVTARVTEIPKSIVLRRGANVTGRFADADGKPLDAVRVRAEAWLRGSSAVAMREAVSDKSGRWTLETLPAGVRAVVVATRAGLAPLRREIDVERSLDLGTISLAPGATLTLRLIDDGDGRPVAGARVEAKPERQAKTNEKGVARLADVSSHDVIEITATADRYLPRKIRLSPPFEEAVDVELTRAFTVRGRFTDAAGEPIAGAIARVATGNSFRDVALDGAAFEIALQPDEPATIELASPATRVTRLEVEGKRGELQDVGTIHPEDGPLIRGRATDPAGAPVAGASIWAPRVGAGGAVVAWATANVIRTETDSDGTFVLRGGGPEPLLLRVDASGRARAFRSVSFDDAGSDVDAGTITLTEGATVTVRGRGGADSIARVAFRPESSDIDSVTAPLRDGVATIRHVPAGRAVVTLTRGRSTICEKEIDVAEAATGVEVDCSASAVRVRGTVLLGDQPASGGTLTWSSPHSSAVGGVIMNNVSRLGAREQQAYGASSDVVFPVSGSGTFETDDLRPGRWQVRWSSPDGGSTVPRDVSIPEEPQTAVTLRYDDVVVHGVVVDGRSAPVSRASVRQTNGNCFAISRDDGTFTIVGIAPGTHTFRAEAAGVRSEAVAVKIDAGRRSEPVRLVLAPEERAPLTIRVLAASGEPAANAFVFIETSSGESRIVTTGSDGTAPLVFRDEPPATLRCAAVHNGSWVLDTWRPAESWRDGLTLTMGASGSLVMTREESGGMVSIIGPNGWDLRMLLLRIGSVPLLEPGVPLQIAGVPPGEYDIRLAGTAVRATVRAGETTRITLRN